MMMQPSLIETEIARRIQTRLTPVKEDNWGPTRAWFGDFYQRRIKPNALWIIIGVLIIIFLIYRYRQTLVQRKLEKLKKPETEWKPDKETIRVIQEELEQMEKKERQAALEKEIAREIRRQEKQDEEIRRRREEDDEERSRRRAKKLESARRHDEKEYRRDKELRRVLSSEKKKKRR